MLKKLVIGIFIDPSKAFDIIDHKILLHKLYNYGIRGIAHNLIESYLSNRFQSVKIDDEKSDKLSVRYGVPQGSVHGPLLFLLYINDLKNLVNTNGTKMILYADDTNIFIACDSLHEANQLSNEVLSHVQEYMYSNLLHINLDKCCFMYFPPTLKHLKGTGVCPSNKSQELVFEKTGINISINNIPVKEATEVRFLGVMLDPLLSWKAHIQHLTKKLKVSFAIIKRICPYIPSQNYKSIYHTLFESHLSYCISVWGGAKRKLIEKIFVLQKGAVRYIFGDYDSFIDKFKTAARTRAFGEQYLGQSFYRKEHTKPAFVKNNLLTVHNLFKYMAINELAKLICLRSPAVLLENLHVSRRNNKNLIIISNTTSNKCVNNSIYITLRYWNVLVKKLKIPNPNEILLCSLKHRLKAYLLDKQKTGCPLTWEPENTN